MLLRCSKECRRRNQVPRLKILERKDCDTVLFSQALIVIKRPLIVADSATFIALKASLRVPKRTNANPFGLPDFESVIISASQSKPRELNKAVSSESTVSKGKFPTKSLLLILKPDT